MAGKLPPRVLAEALEGVSALLEMDETRDSVPRPRARISIHACTLETEVLTVLASASAIKERLVRKESLTVVFG
jgi:hypothetical protein